MRRLRKHCRLSWWPGAPDPVQPRALRPAGRPLPSAAPAALPSARAGACDRDAGAVVFLIQRRDDIVNLISIPVQAIVGAGGGDYVQNNYRWGRLLAKRESVQPRARRPLS